MKKVIILLTAVIISIFITSCGTGGAFQATNVTNVELSQPNFNIVARGLSGTSMQGYLLGLSISQGSDASAFGFLKVAGDDKLYDTAIRDLWENYKKDSGDIEGKNLALINIRQDAIVLNTILYTQTNLFVTADVVEFIK